MLPFSLAFVMALQATPPAAAPPSGDAEAAGTTRMVVPGAHYRVGPLRRWLFGNHYRTLWTAPLPAEVIDLHTFSGGLTPRRKGGGKQTRSLKLQGADGRRWKFRSLDKDPSAVLPPELRETFVDAIVQDQISAANPAGPLVVDALSAAAGVPYVPHRLVVLPDDPALGEFQKEFGGLVGFLEEEIELKAPVTPGFEGYTRMLDTVEMWERLDKHPEEKVDARALLRARLFDMFLGDFDRHKDQWQWAKPREGEMWQPVPEDRDQAFAKYDGLVLALIRPAQPRLVDFEEHYPRIFGLTWQGRFLDRRHLSELDWPQWEQVARDLQGRLTDSVIDDAVHRLPEAHYRLGGADLTRRLKARRDALITAGRAFYRQLAQQVEYHGSDGVETVDVAPGEAGTVRITVSGDDGAVRFRRDFRPEETSEVRLFLDGGDDRVVRKPGTGAITVRVVGGSGNDVLDDTQSGHTHFYDSQGDNRVLRGPGTGVDERPYTQPNAPDGNPERDWGRMVTSLPLLSAGGDLGVYLGAQVSLIGYGFRKHPYSYKHTLSAGYATSLTAFQAEYDGRFYRTNSRTYSQLVLRGSQIDVLRFYGLGNETPTAEDEDFFRVEQNFLSISPSVHFGAGNLDWELGAFVQRTNTKTPADTFVGQTRPYGVDIFGEAGLRTRLTLGHRDLDRTTSAYVWAGGTYFPKVWDVQSAFGNMEGQAALFLAPRVALGPQIGFRIGAKKVFGTFPFHESAFVGGPDELRGLRPQRYAGDASAFGSAELHLRLFEAPILLPTEVSLIGLADIGRVWVQGEDSTKWHQGYGGGLLFAPLKRSVSLSVTLARSEGLTRFYLLGGFAF